MEQERLITKIIVRWRVWIILWPWKRWKFEAVTVRKAAGFLPLPTADPVTRIRFVSLCLKTRHKNAPEDAIDASWKFYRLSRFLVEKSSFLFCPRIYLPFNFLPYLTLLRNDQWLNIIICLHFCKHPFYAYQWNSFHGKGCDYTRNIRGWKIWAFGSWISRNYQNENLQVSAVPIWKINFSVSSALQVGSWRVERHIDITLYVYSVLLIITSQ